jgi:hypothetical protein
MATVYPTLRVPVMYKPFYGDVTAATWNLPGLNITTDENNQTVARKAELPLSYKFEGCIHNGLTYGNKFYSGETATEGSQQTYATYLIDNTKSDFYNVLTPGSAGDYNYDRAYSFGVGSTDAAYSREVTKYDESISDIEKLSYAVYEGYPVISENDALRTKILSGRYDNGFDTENLEDSCVIDSAFHKNFKVYAYSRDGIDGVSCLLADSIPSTTTTELYAITGTSIFSVGDPIISDGSIFEARYCYGTYNKNATYDNVGASVTVRYFKEQATSIEWYRYPIKNSDGTTVTKTAFSLDELYNNGVTLLRKTSLYTNIKRNASSLNSIISSNGLKVTATTLSNGAPSGTAYVDYTVFDGETGNGHAPKLANITALVAKYERPAASNRNKMLVYKLYPINGLDIMCPAITVTPPEQNESE